MYFVNLGRILFLTIESIIPLFFNIDIIIEYCCLSFSIFLIDEFNISTTLFTLSIVFILLDVQLTALYCILEMESSLFLLSLLLSLVFSLFISSLLSFFDLLFWF